MKKYKIIASDFDDTLLRTDGTISEFTRKTISDFCERGGTFLISTGRMMRSALEQAKSLKLKGSLISYQGGMINDIETGKQLFHSTLTKEDALFNLKLMEKPGTGVIHVYHNDVLYIERKNPYSDEYQKVCNVPVTETGISLSEFVSKNNISPTKLLMMDTPENCLKMVEECERLYGGKYYYCLSKPTFFEVAKLGVSKGAAVEFVAKSLGLTLDDVVAIGDSINDIPMIEAAGLGVAVANALPKVKETADIVGKSNDEDAVADIILRYGI